MEKEPIKKEEEFTTFQHIVFTIVTGFAIIGIIVCISRVITYYDERQAESDTHVSFCERGYIYYGAFVMQKGICDTDNDFLPFPDQNSTSSVPTWTNY